MNDFNKEELQEMLIGLGWLYEVSTDHDFLDKLSSKIQSMVDNYCEHASLFSMGENKHCCKCGEWFNDNQ